MVYYSTDAEESADASLDDERQHEGFWSGTTDGMAMRNEIVTRWWA
jgi:hypothetical protein